MQAALFLPRLATVVACVLPWAIPAQAQTEVFRNVQALDQRITDIGYRLQRSGGALCPHQAALTGFAIHDLSQYLPAQQDGARQAYGFAGAPLVLTVAHDSPAAALLRIDDALLAIDGQPVPAATVRKKSYDRVAAVLARIDAAAADGVLELELRRAGQPLSVRIELERGCPSRFQTVIDDSIASQADGTYVEISSGMAAFAGTDDQLATIVAHELAHNILRHRARLNAAGISRGVFGQFGRNARLTRQTEEEADRLGVYLMVRAGYPPQAAVDFWQRYDKTHPFDFLRPATHMDEKNRVRVIREEIARIAAMAAAGESPRPAFLAGPTLPALK